MKFSVLLPTYNRLDLLKYAIESVVQQDYHNWELIISDNQSEEGVQGYVASLQDDRIKYSRTTELLNVTDNWNRALLQAEGDYFVMLGDDDALMPQYFSKMLPVINAHDEPDWIYTEAYEYAYPDVLPNHPDGLLVAGRNPMASWQGVTLLDDNAKVGILSASFKMYLRINFNMQHSLVKRAYAQSLEGDFYRSLFPDYYATLAGLITAPNFLIYPEAMVVIGITRKSHGFYYFNNQLADAKNILHSDAINRAATDKIAHVLLPAMDWIQVGWVSALHELTLSYPEAIKEFGIPISLQPARNRIIRFHIKKHLANELSPEMFDLLQSALSGREYVQQYLPFYWYYKLGLKQRVGLLRRLIHSQRRKQPNPQPGEPQPMSNHIHLATHGAKNIIDIVQNFPTEFSEIHSMSQE